MNDPNNACEGDYRLTLFRRDKDQETSKRSILTFNQSWKTKRVHFAEASDGVLKNLADNSAQRNTKKSTKYARTI